MSTDLERNSRSSVLDPLLESASDEVLRLAADTIFKQLLQRNSPINRSIEEMQHPSGPEHRLGNLQNLLSAMGGFSHERVTPEMLALANLSAAVEGSPVFEDNTPEAYGVHPGFLAALLRTHAAGGDTDALISKYLRTGEGTPINPGRYAPPERQTRLFEGQSRVDLPGLRAAFWMRTTGQNAPEQLLPKDVTGLLKLQAGINGVIGSLDQDITHAVAAVRADQEAKMTFALSLFDQTRAMIPALIESFKATLGTRIEKTLITDRRMDTHGTERVLPDGTMLGSSHSRQRNENRNVDIVAPAVHGVLTLPSFTINTGTSEAMQFSGAGFGINDGEEAVVEVHRGTQAVEVIAHGHTAFAAAQATEVKSGGMTIELRGGSIKIGG